jgi:hypothetical protein
MKLTGVWAVLVLLVCLTGCATQQDTRRATLGDVQPQPKFEHVSFSVSTVPGQVLPVFFFFDHESGNLWILRDLEAPPLLIGRLESFDKPFNLNLPPGVRSKTPTGG